MDVNLNRHALANCLNMPADIPGRNEAIVQLSLSIAASDLRAEAAQKLLATAGSIRITAGIPPDESQPEATPEV